MLKVYLSSDHITAATSKTVAITVSKNGGAFGNPNAGATNATEVANGWYKVTVDTTDTGTVGDLVVRGTATSCDDSERIFGVVKATNAGLTALPDTANTTNASLLTSGTGTDQLSVSSGRIDLGKALGTTITESSPGYLAGGIKKFFDVAVPVHTVASLDQTGDSFSRIGATGSGLSSLAPAISALSTALWTATIAGRIDAAVSSRLAPTTASRTLDVSATGEAGLDWANIGSPTTTVALTGTTVGVVTTVTNAVTATVSAFTSFLTGATRPFIDYISWLARSDANVNATAGTEINAAGSGSGTFSNQTKSLQSATDETTLVSDVTTAVAARIIADHGTGVYTDQNGTLGAGAWIATVTVKDTDNNALAGASVRLTSTLDSGIYTGQYTTDSSGVALVNVIDGSYYQSVTLAGYTYTVITVTTSGNTPLSATMTASAITPATGSGTTVYITLWDWTGVTAAAGETLNFRFIDLITPVEGQSFPRDVHASPAANSNGLIQQTLRQLAYYEVQRGTGSEWYRFSTSDQATTSLPAEVLGKIAAS